MRRLAIIESGGEYTVAIQRDANVSAVSEFETDNEEAVLLIVEQFLEEE